MTAPPIGRALVWVWRLFVLALLLAAAVAWWDYQDRWHTPGLWLRNLVMLWLYWAPRLAGPLLWIGLVGLATTARGWLRAKALVGALLVTIGLWSSLVEPGLSRVRVTTLHGRPAGAQPVRLAVVADIHWGLFYRDGQLAGLVRQLNALDVDAVLAAGDWTHEPPLDLKQGLAPLAALRHPVFGVLGNHDVQSPGPDLTQPLREALMAHGVQLLEGRALEWKGWQLVGLDDGWGGHPERQIRSLWPASGGADPDADRRLVLTHQPDTVALLPKDAAHLSVAGHTHGGQIWIPGFTPWFLRHTNTLHPWWNGLYKTPAGPLLVTPGIGTIGLPARLAVVPTIDVVELR